MKLLSIIKTLISEDDRLVKGSKVLAKTNYKGYNYVLEYGDHAFRRFDRYQNIEPMTKEEVIEMFYEALPELSKRAFGTNRTAIMSPIIDGIAYLKDKKTGQTKKLQQPIKFYIIRRSNSNAQVLIMVNDYEKADYPKDISAFFISELYVENLRKEYPLQINSKVLLPYRRLFVIGRKGS